MPRVLALDHGRARCGVAVSDPSGTLATPLAVIDKPDSGRGLDAIAVLVREREVERVVVGLPTSLDGGESDQARAARAFAGALARRLGKRVPVELEDERFTTRMAQRDPAGARGDEDSRAAAHLLEGWLARAG
jgi:putative Holliday junction resolvase